MDGPHLFKWINYYFIKVPSRNHLFAEQMWSIHAFVRSGESLKQIPLVICLMSRRKTRDYTAVSIFVLYNEENIKILTMCSD
jgi:hypothetical protein